MSDDTVCWVYRKGEARMNAHDWRDYGEAGGWLWLECNGCGQMKQNGRPDGGV